MGLISKVKGAYSTFDTITTLFANAKDNMLMQMPAVLFTPRGNDSKFADIFLFNDYGIGTGNNVELNSQITKHYTEANVTINDHWAIEPIKYTLTGKIGEVLYKPNMAQKFIQQTTGTSKSILGAIAPKFTGAISSAINKVTQVTNTIQRYADIVKNFVNSKRFLTNQQSIILALRELQYNRSIITIYTPYGEIDNLALTNIIMRQENSKMESYIELTFEEWRSVETAVRSATQDEVEGFAQMQQEQEEDSGVATTQNKGSLKSVAKEMGLGNVLRGMLKTIF